MRICWCGAVLRICKILRKEIVKTVRVCSPSLMNLFESTCVKLTQTSAFSLIALCCSSPCLPTSILEVLPVLALVLALDRAHRFKVRLTDSKCLLSNLGSVSLDE